VSSKEICAQIWATFTTQFQAEKYMSKAFYL